MKISIFNKTYREIQKISISAKIIFLISIDLIFILINFVFLHHYIEITRADTEIVNENGVIRGAIQKTIKLETNDIYADKDIDKINNYLTKYLLLSHNESNDDYTQVLKQLNLNWEQLKTLIYDYRISKDANTKKKLIAKSEVCWDHSNHTVDIAQLKAEQKHLLFSKIYYILAFDFIIILFIMYIVYSIIRLKMEEQARIDPLTKVFNRHVYYEEMKMEISRAKRYKQPLSIILLDIDFFKKVNDKYGHDEGDKVLVKFANLIKSNIRAEDIFCRIGGEEFIIISPYIKIEDTKVFAEKLRITIQEYDFAKAKTITASMGIAPLDENDTPQTLFKKADNALYISKDKGRNKVTCI